MEHEPIIMMEIDENVSVRRRRRQRGLPEEPIDWPIDMREVYHWHMQVGRGCIVHDFFGDPLTESVLMQNWNVAIVPERAEQARFKAFVADAAYRFWNKHRDWRLGGTAGR